MPGKQSEEGEPVVAELRQISRLLTLVLLKAGATSEEIAMATGSGSSTIRRDFPASQVKPFRGVTSLRIKG